MKGYDPATQSIIGFIRANNIQNERGDLINFRDRPFLYDPMRDWSRFQCYKKAAQGIGMSVTMQIKSFYSAQHKNWTFIHSMPTSDDIRRFVKTKVNPMIDANKCWQGIESDSIELKKIGERFIIYKGTGSGSGALSDTADVVIQDEKDRSDQGFLKDLESRTINSDYRGVWSLSNPSIDGAGVDADWKESDKKEWLVTCKNGHSHPMVWPDSIDIGGKRYICSECGETLTDEQRRRGKWVQTGDPKAKWSGYHMTLLFAPKISAEYIIEQWAEGKNEEYFHNFILGEPYSPADTRVARHAILDNWTPRNIDTGKYYLGVDIGNVKHYVLGSDKGVLEVGTFTEWHKLDELLTKYQPMTVIDAMPENTMAHHYKDTYQNVFLCHFGRDKENNKIIRWGEKDKQGLVFADRNRAIDALVSTLLGGDILFSLPSDKSFREFVKHCEDLRRVKEVNNMGIERYVWDSLTGEDHYFFALLYYSIAVQMRGTGAVIPNQLEEVPSIVRTRDGFDNNLKEMLERREYER